MAAFPLGYALFQFPGGCWADRKGPKFTLTAITVTWGLLIALTSLTPTRDVAPVYIVIGFLLTIQFLVGAAHAPVFPIVVTAIERGFPPGGWALPNGLSSAGLTIGLAATASALPWLIEQFGWRNGFLILAPFALLASTLWWWYASDYPQEHPSVNAAEVDLLAAPGKPSEGDVADEPVRQPCCCWVWDFHPNAYVSAGMLGACFFFNQFTEGAFAANGAAIGGRHAGAVYGLFNTGANLMGFVNAILLSSIAVVLGWSVAIAMGSVFAVLPVVFILFSRADQQMDQAH